MQAEAGGVLVADKPQGFTSFDVVAKLRGICGTRQIGHGGTLDPMATGVLPVFVGGAVKAADMAIRGDKTYEAELLLGVATDTGDITGAVLDSRRADVSEAALREALPCFLGEQKQLPPMYSAVKVRGKPLYSYAREGKTVRREPRDITIFGLELRGQTAKNRFAISVHCSKGTYIRALAEDIGARLGLPATLFSLRRTAAGVFTLRDAHTLSEIQAARDEGCLPELFVPAERIFEGIPDFAADAAGMRRLLNGAAIYGVRGEAGRRRLFFEGRFLGMGLLAKDGELRAEKLFYRPQINP